MAGWFGEGGDEGDGHRIIAAEHDGHGARLEDAARGALDQRAVARAVLRPGLEVAEVAHGLAVLQQRAAQVPVPVVEPVSDLRAAPCGRHRARRGARDCRCRGRACHAVRRRSRRQSPAAIADADGAHERRNGGGRGHGESSRSFRRRGVARSAAPSGQVTRLRRQDEAGGGAGAGATVDRHARQNEAAPRAWQWEVQGRSGRERQAAVRTVLRGPLRAGRSTACRP